MPKMLGQDYFLNVRSIRNFNKIGLFGLAGAFEQEFTVSPFILVKSISYVRNKTTSSAELRGCQLIEKAIYFFLTVCFGSNAPASPKSKKQLTIFTILNNIA